MLFPLGCHLTWQHIWEFWWSFLRLFCFCLNLSVKHNAAEQTAIFLSQLNYVIQFICLCENQFYVLTTLSKILPVYSYCFFSWPIYNLKLFQYVFVGRHQRRWDMVHWHLSSIPDSCPWYKVLYITRFQHLLLLWCYVFHRLNRSQTLYLCFRFIDISFVLKTFI